MVRPLRDYILVKPLGRPQSDVIQVVSTERPNLGLVLATGPGKANKKGKIEPLDVKTGQTVRFGEFAFPEVQVNGVRCLMMQEADIAGVVDALDSEAA